MKYLNKDLIKSTLNQISESTKTKLIGESVSNSFIGNTTFKIMNWKTDEINESEYESSEAAFKVVNESQTPTDFLVIQTKKKES